MEVGRQNSERMSKLPRDNGLMVVSSCTLNVTRARERALTEYTQYGALTRDKGTSSGVQLLRQAPKNQVRW
jgi:hypothetical protein